jgi:hypothetical protein
MNWKPVALVAAFAGALPAAALGAGHVPTWMEGMMGSQAPPEMRQMMDNPPPGMAQMMQTPGMEQAMQNTPQGMEQMMGSPGMQQMMDADH